MKIDELKKDMQTNFNERIAIVDSKSHDYATDDDVMSNFKRNALLARIFSIDVKNPEDVAFYEFIKKIDRERNLKAKGAKPKNEGREDTRRDMNNYCDYYYVLLNERCGIAELAKTVLKYEMEVKNEEKK